MNATTTAKSSLPRRERQRLDRRRYVLEAAETVFARRGYHETSMEEIARAAEYATGTVYLYFKSKEELYAALFEGKVRDMVTTVQRRAADAKEPIEAMRQLVLAQLEFFDGNRAFFRIFINANMDAAAESKNAHWQGVHELYRGFLRCMEKGVAEGQRKGIFRKGEPMLYALALLGVVNTLTRAWLEQESARPLTEQADFIVELALNGIAK